jgi:hypothetical protein
MTLGMPIALTLAFIAIPIVVLYILKLRLRRVPVSTNLFWNQIFEEKPPKSLWQTLRHWLSLLAQLIILGLLVMAIADPLLAWHTKRARRIVLVMDISASMQATDVNPSRFAVAQQMAQRFLDGVRELDNVAVLSAGVRPEVVIGMGNHVPSLRRVIDDLSPVDTPVSLEAAIQLAKQLIGDSPNGQIILFTDQHAKESQDILPTSENKQRETDSQNTEPQSTSQSIQIEYRTIGTDASNVGITQFQTRRSMVDALGYELLIQVKNASNKPVQCRLEIELEQRPVDVLPLKLQPNETWSRTLEKTSLDGGVLKALLTQFLEESGEQATDTNVLAVDDTAWAILPPRRITPVLIVSPGNLFLKKVFEANPLVEVTTASEIPTTWPEKGIVVLHRLIPEKLPPNPLMIIDPDSDSPLFRVEGLVDSPLVTEQDKNSPLMMHVRLDNVSFPNTKKLAFVSEQAHSLASSVGGESIYATVPHGDQKALVLGVNLEQSDIAFRTVFPILASNAMAWFSGQSGELSLAVAAGNSTVRKSNDDIRLGETAMENLWLVSPTNHVERQVGQTTRALTQTGVWELIPSKSDRTPSNPKIDAHEVPSAESLRNNNDRVERLAVNLANADETDIRSESESQGDQSLSSFAAWFSYPIWFYLALLIGLVLVLEWGMYQRRVLA